ncbi:MAG: hypothetical protein KDA61_03385, partial [Planctomycetales bacterium]|nr:hypothetical protein [Planctomycetales bacterium]
MPTLLCYSRSSKLLLQFLVWLFVAFALSSPTQAADDALATGFATPPPAAWPRTWWHWTKGNVTKEGITKDLEWMQRAGIAGFQLADVNFGGGQSVDTPLEFGSEAWRDAVGHAAREAQRLGLEMAVFSSPGWSMTGGPWVRPEQAMKRLTWSETQVDGSQTAPLTLPMPPTCEGAFQDLRAGNPPREGTYQDVRVIAFPTPTAEHETHIPSDVASSGPSIEGALLHDGRYNTSVSVKPDDEGGVAWIEQRFDAPTTMRAVTLAGDAGIPVGRLLASDDGVAYRTFATLPGSQLYRQARVRTFAFPATTARIFRLELTGSPIRPAETMSEAPPERAASYSLAEWRMHAGARLHRWEEKAGFGHLFEYRSVEAKEVDVDSVVDPARLIDVSRHLQSNGELAWQPPDGKWTVLRMGWALTGARNRPATPSGSGVEVDKLSQRHVNDYYDA